jgi:hypothetical protein
MPSDDPITRAENAELALQATLEANGSHVAAIRSAVKYLEGLEGVLVSSKIEPVKPSVLKNLKDELPENADPTEDELPAFDLFWKAYPKHRHTARKKALAIFKSKCCSTIIGKLLDALDARKKTIDWLKDDGQYVPHPTTWLNQERWNDEITPAKTPQGNW